MGIVLQTIQVDGFTETAPVSGITALTFGGQRRNSAVTELGYQASIDYGIWQPFAKAVWNHELIDKDRLVTATLTTTAAPSFSLPAVELGQDWGTGIVGARLKLGTQDDGLRRFHRTDRAESRGQLRRASGA